MKKELIAAWRANQQMNLIVLESVSAEGMVATLSKRGGRGVAGELAHIHNNRVWQLEKRAKDLAEGLEKFATGVAPNKRELKSALTASGKAIESFLVGVLNDEPRRRGFKRGVFTTLAYLVSHESHHRGRILLTLKVSGHTLDKAAQYRLWDWDRV